MTLPVAVILSGVAIAVAAIAMILIIPELETPYQSRRLEPGYDECCICAVQISNLRERRSLRCSHKFHTYCINQWLERSRSCPICRSTVSY